MIDSNANIFWQLQKKEQQEALLSLDLNPSNSIPTNYSNQQPSLPNDATKKNYNWSYKYFTYNLNNYGPLNQDILNYAPSNVLFQDYPSANGNLTVGSVPSNVVNLFEASIFKLNQVSTNFFVNWSGGIAIYLNSGVLVKNDYNPFTSASIPLNLGAGWNDLKILLYTPVIGQAFSLNSEIGLFADDWTTPSLSIPPTPQNISASIDLNAVAYKDGNSAILRWDSTDPSVTFGYNIYRVGPYNSGLSVPSGIITSGYYVSGVNGLRLGNTVREAYYSVSAYTNAGESLPAGSFKCSLSPVFSGVYFVSGISSGISGGSLIAGDYSYIVAATNPIGSKFASNNIIFTQVTNTGNCNVLNWSGALNVSNYTIYRFSGIINTTPDVIPLLTGQLLSTVLSSQLTFIDSGYMPAYQTGISQLASDWINLATNTYSLSNYSNNSSYISWAQTSGASGYYIYRTFYSGNYDKNSLVATTTGLFFIDTGVIPNQGKPTLQENINSVNFGTKKYKDQGVIGKQTYQYSITSYNYGLNESPQSSGVIVTIGNSAAPNTPSGITITSFNGFSTLGWQNGVEPDLYATKIYQSTDNITYNVIGTSLGTTYSTFIGYSGSPYFKLSNINTSNNESALSSSYQGSGTFVANNIVLNSFNTLKTTDVFPMYYLQTGIVKAKSAPYRSSLFASVTNSDTLAGSQLWANWLDSADNNKMNNIQLDVVNGTPNGFYINNAGQLDVSPSGISGIYSIILLKELVPSPASFDNRMFVTFYSGFSGNYTLHYKVYQNDATVATSTTGIKIGNYINNELIGYSSYLSPNPRPVMIAYSGNFDKNIIVFVSGNVADSGIALGFLGLTYAGAQTGVCKYLPVDASIGTSISACYDNNGFIHVFSDSNYLTTSDRQPLLWYKLSVSFSGNTPITVLGSGSYTRKSNGVGNYGGFVFPENDTSQYNIYNPRVFCDKYNNISVFAGLVNNRDNISYCSIDTNGNIITTPYIQFQMPFSIDPDSWNVTYDRLYDRAYSNFNYIGQLTGTISQGTPAYANANYNFGSYLRSHVFERYNNVSLYQIIQSIIK